MSCIFFVPTYYSSIQCLSYFFLVLWLGTHLPSIQCNTCCRGTQQHFSDITISMQQPMRVLSSHSSLSLSLKSQSRCVHNLHLQYVVIFIWRFVIVSQNFTRVHLVPPELWNRINWSVSERVSPVVLCSNMRKCEIQNTRAPHQCTFRWNQREGTKEKNENSI